LARSIAKLSIDNNALKDHIQNLKEMQESLKKASETKSHDDQHSTLGKVSEWFYDFVNCSAQALLDWDPAKAGQSFLKMISDLAGADVFKDNVQKLADKLKNLEDAMDKTIAGLSAFSSAEAATDRKQLAEYKQELANERSDFVTETGNYHDALVQLFKDSDKDGIAQQLTAAVRKAIETSLSALNAAAATMKDSPLRDSKYQSAMVPLGDFAFVSDNGVFYRQGNRTNAFHTGSGIARADIEQMAGGLTGAVKAVSDLDAAVARVNELSKLWDEAAAKAFGF